MQTDLSFGMIIFRSEMHCGQEEIMNETEGTIRSGCPLYSCRVCRTKTGWPHQVWCELKLLTVPGCTDCRYHDPLHGSCVHPAMRKGGAA